MYECTHVHIQVHTRVCSPAYTNVHTHACIRFARLASEPAYMRTFEQMRTCAGLYISTKLFKHKHAYVHTHALVHARTRGHAGMDTCTLGNTPTGSRHACAQASACTNAHAFISYSRYFLSVVDVAVSEESQHAFLKAVGVTQRRSKIPT